MRSSSNALRGLALAGALATLAGCSEYLDHRDLISIQGGNAVQTDKITQMVDPWPRASGDRNIAFSGTNVETAYARYRTGHVIPPNGTGTSSSYQSGQNNPAPLGPTVEQSATPAK
jgi:hypothetical protein